MDDLVSLRILLVSASERDREILRRAAATASVPLDVLEASDAAAARPLLARGVDVMFLDAGIPAAERAAFIADARTARPQPSILLIAASKEDAVDVAEAGADGVIVLPASAAEATGLFDRSIRQQIPSRALVVDDSATMRGIVRKILAASRFRIDIGEAEEGVDALRQLASGKFDLVFLDYNMPGLNGVETLSEIKRQYPQVAVVIMTSTVDKELVRRARKAGAAAFLKKPFYPSDIDAILQNVLAGQRS